MVALLGEVSVVTFNGKGNRGRDSPSQDLTPACCALCASRRKYGFLVTCRRPWWWLELCLNLMEMVKEGQGQNMEMRV